MFFFKDEAIWVYAASLPNRIAIQPATPLDLVGVGVVARRRRAETSSRFSWACLGMGFALIEESRVYLQSRCFSLRIFDHDEIQQS